MKNNFIYCPLIVFQRSILRQIYSRYLRGQSIEAIMDYLYLKSGTQWTIQEINSIIDQMNDCYEI
jgi:hypothetical protein